MYFYDGFVGKVTDLGEHKFLRQAFPPPCSEPILSSRWPDEMRRRTQNKLILAGRASEPDAFRKRLGQVRLGTGFAAKGEPGQPELAGGDGLISYDRSPNSYDGITEFLRSQPELLRWDSSLASKFASLAFESALDSGALVGRFRCTGGRFWCAGGRFKCAGGQIWVHGRQIYRCAGG